MRGWDLSSVPEYKRKGDFTHCVAAAGELSSISQQIKTLFGERMEEFGWRGGRRKKGWNLCWRKKREEEEHFEPAPFDPFSPDNNDQHLCLFERFF